MVLERESDIQKFIHGACGGEPTIEGDAVMWRFAAESYFLEAEEFRYYVAEIPDHCQLRNSSR